MIEKDVQMPEVEKIHNSEDFSKNVERVLRRYHISERDLNIFNQIYGLGGEDEKTPKEIANEVGLDYQTVLKIHKKYLTSLKVHFRLHKENRYNLLY